MGHIFHGFTSDGLIEGKWLFGRREILEKSYGPVPSDGIICQPSALGAELFLWAFGYGEQALDYILTSNFSAEIDGLPDRVENAVPTST